MRHLGTNRRRRVTSPKVPFLPYGRQSIDDDDIAAVTTVLKSDYLTTGPTCPAFEEAFAKAVGATDAVACSSGTTALHLALLGLDVGEGDAVVVPSITFLATANAARFVGADVVFADVDPATGLMTPETFSQALARTDEKRVRAVIPVHLGGQCADMQAIAEIARAHDMFVVEDACHALGGAVDGAGGGDLVGACAYSDCACFSLHPVKTIAMGEGGAVSCRDAALAARMRAARSHFMVSDKEHLTNRDMAFDEHGDVNPWYYEMPELGYNFRASDIHCALGLSQLSKLGRFVSKRRERVALYDEALSTCGPLLRPLERLAGQMPAWHLYQVLIDFAALGVSRSHVMGALREHGVGTQVHYIPVHKQPYYRDQAEDSRQ